MADHTKTPWKVSGRDYKVRVDGPKQTVATANVVWSSADGESIGYPEAEANAAFIVLAVNAHDDLVAVVREACAIFDLNHEGGDEYNGDLASDLWKNEIHRKLTEALAKAAS